MRLGIIGAGLATKGLHWPPLKRMADEFKITFVADISPEAAQEVAGLAGGCRWTQDYHEVLASSDVDAVLVALPIHLNAQAIFDCVRAGKHVICEKPVGSNLEQAREVVSLTEDAPVVAMIAENCHYRQDVAKARKWLEEGRIGTPFMVQASCYYWNDTSEGFASTPWRIDSQYRGGVITDVGVHHMAILRELCGEAEQVQAFTKLVHPEMSGVDTMVLNLRFRNGALGQFLFTDAAVEAESPIVSIILLGTEGTIWLEDGVVRLRKRGDREETREKFDPDEAYYEQLVDFYEAIRGRATVKTTPYEAMRDLEIIMRAYDSAESRSVLLLNDVTRKN